uniref:Uncharacterized protein n=1 Tax=Rhizophora mucronata TaxID=61149 RepID=A0A2P2Q4X7_RHIMU
MRKCLGLITIFLTLINFLLKEILFYSLYGLATILTSYHDQYAFLFLILNWGCKQFLSHVMVALEFAPL